MDYAPPPAISASAPSPCQFSSAATEVEQEALLKKIQEKLPNTVFKSIEPTPLKNIFALKTVGNKIFYTDVDAKFFITGIIFDTTTGKALNNMLEGTSSAASLKLDE